MSHGLIDYRLSNVDLPSFCRNINKYFGTKKKLKNTTSVEKSQKKMLQLRKCKKMLSNYNFSKY